MIDLFVFLFFSDILWLAVVVVLCIIVSSCLAVLYTMCSGLAVAILNNSVVMSRNSAMFLCYCRLTV